VRGWLVDGIAEGATVLAARYFRICWLIPFSKFSKRKSAIPA
jgi:hypothetical protein